MMAVVLADQTLDAVGRCDGLVSVRAVQHLVPLQDAGRAVELFAQRLCLQDGAFGRQQLLQ